MSISLVQLFDAARQAALRERLGRASNLQDIADAIHDELAEFARVDGPYVKGLTRTELPVGLAILALVRESNGQLVQAAPRESQAKQVGNKGKRSSKNASLQNTIVTVSATLGASAGFFLGAIGGIVGAALVGAGATLLFGRSNGGFDSGTETEPIPDVKLDTQKVCEGILRLLKKIDDLVQVFGEAQNTRPIDRPLSTLADFPEVLRLFQLMWSAVMSDSKEELLAIIQRQFPSLLRGQGLEVVRLSDAELNVVPGENGQFAACDVEFSNNVSEPTLDYPPIRSKEAVIARGRVLIPSRAKE